ncbi:MULTISPECIES: N-acetyltransferase [unclassified Pseudomonas]|uniref:N-acetyltransferase n=1 Tax=unclassified Pseudomonas TaxID=196821 RepID=UPI00384FC7C5
MGSVFAAGVLGIDGRQVKFEPIDRTAISACEHWEGSTYPWENVSSWKRLDAKGFDLAIWYNQTLCGLCYATPRQSRLTIKIILLEGKPGSEHPLKGLIAPLALMGVDLYAQMLGCREIEIQQPAVNAIKYYKALGFQFDEARRLVISVGGS